MVEKYHGLGAQSKSGFGILQRTTDPSPVVSYQSSVFSKKLRRAWFLIDVR
jgi:hypothetical protein